jgi:hypothetical protein
MIEVVLRDYLVENLEDIPVLFEKPKTKPDKYVLIHGIDSGVVNHIPADTFSFISTAPSFYEAKLLSDRVRALLFDSIELPTISSAKLGGQNGRAVASESAYEYEIIFNFYHYEEG